MFILVVHPSFLLILLLPYSILGLDSQSQGTSMVSVLEFSPAWVTIWWSYMIWTARCWGRARGVRSCTTTRSTRLLGPTAPPVMHLLLHSFNSLTVLYDILLLLPTSHSTPLSLWARTEFHQLPRCAGGRVFREPLQAVQRSLEGLLHSGIGTHQSVQTILRGQWNSSVRRIW